MTTIIATIFSLLVVIGAWAYSEGVKTTIPTSINREATSQVSIPPLAWGSIGTNMVEEGVIDKEKFLELYANDPALMKEIDELLSSRKSMVQITQKNSSAILNVLWAFGLGNKNEILERGPMMDTRYGGAEGFASTGGWTLAKGDAMDHYSKHEFVKLSVEEQALVEEVSKNIYRPCCNNSTHFPDCNHGMAMLGLLELMAAQGASELEMYDSAYKVNALWFPDTYEAIRSYFNESGIPFSAKTALSKEYSSVTGYQNLLLKIKTLPERNRGGGCSVQ